MNTFTMMNISMMPNTRNNVLVFIRPSSLTAVRERISGRDFVSVEEVAKTKQPPELRLYSHTSVVCECMALRWNTCVLLFISKQTYQWTLIARANVLKSHSKDK